MSYASHIGKVLRTPPSPSIRHLNCGMLRVKEHPQRGRRCILTSNAQYGDEGIKAATVGAQHLTNLGYVVTRGRALSGGNSGVIWVVQGTSRQLPAKGTSPVLNTPVKSDVPLPAAYTKEKAREADLRLADRQQSLDAAYTRLENAIYSCAVAAGGKVTKHREESFVTFGSDKSPVGVSTILDKVKNVDGPMKSSAERSLSRYAEVKEEHTNARALVDDSHREWRENGKWSRFFSVTGGHIHRSTMCPSLRPTTSISWLPELSGETEKDAVEMYGSVLCSKCFPSAPVEWTAGKVKTKNQVASEQRASARAAKRREEEKKLLIDPSTGEHMRSTFGSELRTEVSVRREVLSSLNSMLWYGRTHPDYTAWDDFVQRAYAVLGAKTERTPLEVRVEFEKKALARYTKEKKEAADAGFV